MSMSHFAKYFLHVDACSILTRDRFSQSNRTTFRAGITMPIGDFVDRVMDIIELLADEPKGLPLSEIARRLDMPKSAAHRLLSSLVNRGFAVQDDTSQRYRLTVRLAAVGFRVLAGAGTSDILPPSLDRLGRRTGELVRLALVEGDTLFWIAKAQGALSGLRYDPDLGQAVVLHDTATRKAWR